MLTSKDRIEVLRRKYEPALREMEEQQVNLIQLQMQKDKLYIHGAAPSKQAAERIRRRLSEIDADWSREVDLELDAPGALLPHTGQSTVNHAEDFAHAADDTAKND